MRGKGLEDVYSSYSLVLRLKKLRIFLHFLSIVKPTFTGSWSNSNVSLILRKDM